MGLRRILTTIVGIVQSVIGALAIIFAYMLYHNFFNVRGFLDILGENVPVYMLFLFIFGFVSIISGLFLIHERLES